MHILFVSPRLCVPQQNGSRLREYHLARALCRHADVSYVSFVPPSLEPPSEAALSFFTDVALVRPPRRNRPLTVLRSLAGRWPLPILNYTSAEMKALLCRVIARRQFDFVHIDSFVMAAYAPFLQSAFNSPARIVYDWHNIGSELAGRLGTDMKSIPKRLYARLTARRLERMERWMLRTGFGHAVCSSRERDKLLRMVPDARIAVIENGVDTEYFGASQFTPDHNRIVFVGSMNYDPNIEAAVRFARLIWPQIRERFPSWRFSIVGCAPVPAVLALRNEPGVEVTGTVPDVRPFYRHALAAVVPLRTGGGTRLKILEALAARVPVISTALGAEGLDVSAGKNILIADTDSDWLPALTSLAENPRQRDAFAAAGLELVRSRYDWRALGEQLFSSYCGWASAARAA